MFERFYSAMPEEIDVLGEKMVGHLDLHAVEPVESIQQSAEYLKDWNQHSCLFQRSLVCERDLQLELQIITRDLKGEGTLTLGLEDFLATLSNAHEANTYLLKQRLGGFLKSASVEEEEDLSEDGKESFNALEKAWSGTRTTPVILASEGSEEVEEVEERPIGEDYFHQMPVYEELAEFAKSKDNSNMETQSPPTPVEINETAPLETEVSNLHRYEQKKKYASRKVAGLSYEVTPNDQGATLKVFHDSSGKVVARLEDANVRNSDMVTVLKTADHIFGQLDWDAPPGLLDREGCVRIASNFVSFFDVENGFYTFET